MNIYTTRHGGLRRPLAFGLVALVIVALVAALPVDLSAQRGGGGRGGGGGGGSRGGGGGGSVRQSRTTTSSAGATKANNYKRDTTPSTNANRSTNASRNVNSNNTVNVNNVNVNRNTNVNNAGYGRGGVAVGEEGAVAVGPRGAVAVGEEGFAGVGRYGGVVAGEHYESYEGWKVAAGVATGIAIGTMLARPPTTSVVVVSSGTNYMYADGAYYEQVLLRR